jgi:hypothetical protein
MENRQALELEALRDAPGHSGHVLDVSVAPWGGHALVLIETMTDLGQRVVLCHREGERWVASAGGDGNHVEVDFDGGRVDAHVQAGDGPAIQARWERYP